MLLPTYFTVKVCLATKNKFLHQAFMKQTNLSTFEETNIPKNNSIPKHYIVFCWSPTNPSRWIFL